MVVEALSFGALIRLHLTKLDLRLIVYLAGRFDCMSSTLNVHGRKLLLSLSEVEWIMGFTSRGYDVENFLGKNKHVREMFNLGGSKIQVNKLMDDLSTMPSNDEFKAKFLLFFIVTVIHPTSTFYDVNQKYLGLLKALPSCNKMNWAKYTLEGLVDGIRTFQKKILKPGWNPFISGCVLLLEIFYLEHLAVGSWNIP